MHIGLANEEGFPHTGTMDFVDNQLNPQTGTIRARAVFENKDGRFTPGLFARVQLVGSDEYNAILIDDRAVNTDQSQKYVLLLGPDNKIEYRKIKLGRVIDGLRIVGTAEHKASLVSFTVAGVHPHDLGTILDEDGIAIRTGHHCAMPVMEFFGLPATARASFAFYNTFEEIDRLSASVERARKLFA